jgi:hypothetical protein
MANTLRFKRGLVATIPTAVAGEPLFTTDTFDLYIGNGTTNTRFQKYIASGSSSQLLRGDGSLLTMPIVLTSPSNGQVLKYNGTNWVNDSDAGVTGSGTTNYLPKWTSGSALGNSLVYDNGTNIGIGITTPVSNLTIYNATNTVLTVANGVVPNGTSTGGVVQLFLGGTGSATGNYAFTNDILGKLSFFGYGNNFLYEGAIINSVVTTGGNLDREQHKTALDFYTKTSGLNIPTLRMRLDASGNLGLGVTPSAWASIFNVIEGPRGSVIAFQNNGNSLKLGSNFYFTGANYNYVNTNAAARYDADYEHRWYIAPSGTAGNAISFTQAMTLTGGGNLLLGTTSSAGYLFQANGSIASTNSTAGQLYSVSGTRSIGIQSFAGDWNYLRSNGANLVFGTQDANTLYIRTSDVDRLTITSTGAATFSSSVTATSFNGTTNNIFSVDGTERLRITSGGDLAVGTSGTTYARVQINKSGAGFQEALILENTNSAAANLGSALTFAGVGTVSQTVIRSGWDGAATTDAYLSFLTRGSGSVFERMRITSGGNVGIGTTSPLAKLQVSAGRSYFFSADNYSVGLAQTAAQNNYMYLGTAADGTFYISETSGTARVTVQQGGNFGIGTTSPSYPLEIASTNALSIAYQRTGVAAKKWGFQSDNDSTYWYNITDNVLALTVRNTGIIGIGTTSPAAKLHLVDSVESEIRTQYSTTSSGKLITGNGFTTIGSITNDPLVFVSNNTERMRLTNGGNLLLGSTSDTGEKFQVTGSGIVSGLFTVSGSTGIPATTATYIRFASGFASPDIGRMYIGDGSGWKFHMSKRLSSTTTDLITFFDNGSVQTSAPTGYAAKPYKLGEVLTGATTADRSIVVEIDGTVYFLLASTTLP